MLEKIEMPGFWGVKNATAENGIPDQALLSEIYQRDRVSWPLTSPGDTSLDSANK